MHTLFGMRNRVAPLRVVPASTFPMSTVPISLYLSTTGIMNGPSILRLSDGNSSISWINDGPWYHEQISSDTYSNINIVRDLLNNNNSNSFFLI